MKVITADEFAGYWGLTKEQVPLEFWDYFLKINTSYQEVDKADLEIYIDALVKKVTKSTATRNMEQNLDIFETGWAEHRGLLKQQCSLESVMPKYYNNSLPYYIGDDGLMYRFKNRNLGPDFQVLQMRFLALTHFASVDSIHEFGSGSGLNLLAISSTTPGKQLIGYEWTRSGVELADMIGQLSGQPVSGCHFDMFNPDDSIELQGQAVLTMISIEQLGERYEDFLNFLVRKKPAVVVHIEPDFTTTDASAYLRLSGLYMKLRGYPQTLTQTLRKMETEGRLKIEFFHRLPWMNNYNNWACTIWKTI